MSDNELQSDLQVAFDTADREQVWGALAPLVCGRDRAQIMHQIT